MASMIKVFQLKHPNTGEPVSPVVNVGSIFDKKGQKVDNLLSYRIVGTDMTIPQFHDIQGDLDNRLTTIDNRLNNLDNEINNKITTKVNALNGTMDAATLGGSTKSQIISSARYTHPTTKQCSYSYVHPESQQCSNVNAAMLGGKTLSEIIEGLKSSSGDGMLGLSSCEDLTINISQGEYISGGGATTSSVTRDISDYSLVYVCLHNIYSGSRWYANSRLETADGSKSISPPSATSTSSNQTVEVLVINSNKISIAIASFPANKLTIEGNGVNVLYSTSKFSAVQADGSSSFTVPIYGYR